MKKIFSFVIAVIIAVGTLFTPVWAEAVPQVSTPEYKVAFYAFDNYHMQDENGKKTGYGYEMMEALSYYLQSTFSYVGYEKSSQECVEMLRNGEIDVYTAAKKLPEREDEFAFSTHPAITSHTYMNVKIGNDSIVEGDYSTYNGLRIGLLTRHTYNENFLRWADEKGFSYKVIYYETPSELSQALIDGKVDALVNSYIRTPEDERTVEEFGDTPYYIMVRKEDEQLIRQIDEAMDRMNVEMPNWRITLFNKYYGSVPRHEELTEEEKALLKELQDKKTVIRGVMNPDNKPYSWYENGKAYGIAADIFKNTVKALNLDYEIVTVSTREEYEKIIEEGGVDIWMDVAGYYGGEKYKLTDVYLTTTASVLRKRGASGKIDKVAVMGDNNINEKEILSDKWPYAEIVTANDTKECVKNILRGKVDGGLFMTYTAQNLAREDIQNRLRADIVAGVSVSLRMGINSHDKLEFCGIWKKTLASVSAETVPEITQIYAEQSESPTMASYLFDNPVYMIAVIVAAILIICLILLYIQSENSKRRQVKIMERLTEALEKAEEATAAKQNFFSKMSHDIRTPLNVVLGMTQIAQKYKNEPARLQYALDSISSEGNYLLVLINSILDVNQLEHGYVELAEEPFNPAVCVRNCIDVLRSLADNKSQRLNINFSNENCVVVGDVNRCSQIVINIISNAIKYTNPGGHIYVTLECLPDGRCIFICQDDGIGMSPEFIQHITEDYVRAEDSRVSKTQGTGLGMSVVKGFLELMDGKMDIKSVLGQGSIFTIEIPFKKATQEQCDMILRSDTSNDEHGAKFTGKKVLLVEDNALNAEIAMELIYTFGLSVDWAENGLAGVNRLTASSQGEYFVVFMDMQMPVMDGVSAAREIRASSHPDSNIPIFAMTANTFASDRKLCSDAGMNGYISKPVNIEDIKSALNKCLTDGINND